MADPNIVTSSTKRVSPSTPDGYVIGPNSTDLLGFYGLATPVARRASAAQVAFSDTLTSTSPFGFSDKAHGDALIATVNEIVATLTGLGLWKGGA